MARNHAGGKRRPLHLINVQVLSKSKEDLTESILECPVCLECDGQPKALDCLHWLCVECAQSILNKSHNGKLECPVCRQVTTVLNGNVDKLKNDFRMSQLREILNLNAKEKEEDQSAPTCSVHKITHWIDPSDDTNNNNDSLVRLSSCSQPGCKQKAEVKCRECAMCLCHSCQTQHTRHRLFTGHHIVPIDKVQCTQHDLDYLYICQHCPRLLCSVCALTMCTLHDYHVESIAALAPEATTKLDKVAEILQQEIENKNIALYSEGYYSEEVLNDMLSKIGAVDRNVVEEVLLTFYSLQIILNSTRRRTGTQRDTLEPIQSDNPQSSNTVNTLPSSSIKTTIQFKFKRDEIVENCLHCVYTQAGYLAIAHCMFRSEADMVGNVVLLDEQGNIKAQTRFNGVQLVYPYSMAYKEDDDTLIVNDMHSGRTRARIMGKSQWVVPTEALEDRVVVLNARTLVGIRTFDLAGVYALDLGNIVLNRDCSMIFATNSDKLQAFNLEGRRLRSWKTYGPDNIKFSKTQACIHVDTLDRLWISQGASEWRTALAFHYRAGKLHLLHRVTVPDYRPCLALYNKTVLFAADFNKVQILDVSAGRQRCLVEMASFVGCTKGSDDIVRSIAVHGSNLAILQKDTLTVFNVSTSDAGEHQRTIKMKSWHRVGVLRTRDSGVLHSMFKTFSEGSMFISVLLIIFLLSTAQLLIGAYEYF